MINVQQLRDHYDYGIPYNGDVNRDTVDVLDDHLHNSKTADAAADCMLEINSQIDPLAEHEGFDLLVDALKSAQNAKTKKDMAQYISEALTALETLESDFDRRVEYMRDVMRNTWGLTLKK